MTRTAEDILGAEAIAAVRRPIEKARGLPAGAYTSEEFFRLEQRKYFARTWMGVAYTCDIPDPGDAMPITVAGLPIILVRTGRGDVKAFHNVCPASGGHGSDRAVQKGEAVAVPLPRMGMGPRRKASGGTPISTAAKAAWRRESWTASLWVWSPLTAPCGTTGSSSILTATPRRSRSTCSP